MAKEPMHKVKGETMGGMDFPSKKTRILPTVHLTDEDLPEIKDWKVGEKYTLVMEVEELSMRQGNEWQGADEKDKRIHATFKITSVGVEEEPESSYADDYAAGRIAANNKK